MVELGYTTALIGATAALIGGSSFYTRQTQRQISTRG